MRIHKLNSSVLMVILGLTLTTFGFQNCTKARFVIDDAAKQKALEDGSVLNHGDDGNIPGTGTNTPGDDGNIPGGVRPGDDSSIPGGGTPPGNDSSIPKMPGMGNDPNTPQFPGMGNDPNIPKFPGMGNDPNMPQFPGMGNDPNIPKFPGMGNDPNMPGGNTPPPGDDTANPNGPSSISVIPQAVCGPRVTSSQASLPTASKVVAVLYKSANFGSNTATMIQAWDTEPAITDMRAKLMANQPLTFQLSSPLADGNYSIVIYDAAKVQKPYVYDWGKSQAVIAPIQDSVAHHIDMNSSFKVTNGKASSQSIQVLAGLEGDAVCDQAGSIDPLLIQLKTSTPQLIALTAPENGVMFDLLGRRLNHTKVKTAWFATSRTENYFLVLPNRSGEVLGIDELFGDATLGPDGRYAKQGFAALAKYDDSNDKIISEDDEVFSKLRLWRDDNLDGIAQSSELHTLAEKGVEAIDLRFDPRYQEVDKYGNVTKYKSIIVMKDGQYGLVYDLYLRFLNK